MATIKLQGNASGSGSVTLTAPNTNSTRTVTLPDQDIDLGNLGGAGTVKAWLHFSGGGPTIAAQGNVSSITDDGVGDYHINFTNSLVDANYAPAGWAKDSNNGGSFTIVSAKYADVLTSSSCPIFCRETTAAIDPVDIGVIFAR